MFLILKRNKVIDDCNVSLLQIILNLKSNLINITYLVTFISHPNTEEENDLLKFAYFE